MGFPFPCKASWDRTDWEQARPTCNVKDRPLPAGMMLPSAFSGGSFTETSNFGPVEQR